MERNTKISCPLTTVSINGDRTSLFLTVQELNFASPAVQLPFFEPRTGWKSEVVALILVHDPTDSVRVRSLLFPGTSEYDRSNPCILRETSVYWLSV